MTREELLQAIAITSGFAGIEAFEYYERLHSMTSFIEWYKDNISFDSQEGKKLGTKVIDCLNKKMKITK